jgi:poly(glycerol-phosphate) alpha-glucosyltransferase
VREAKRFVIVSRFVRQKMLEHAIRVFALVIQQEPEARLDIYGDGPTRETIEAEIANLGLEKSVTLHGFDPRARETLWTATGFLMTSRFEGYPLATLEAMSQGCPVISYDIKYGPREQISHGVDGFLVKRGKFQEMADHLVELIRDPELVAKMSDAAFVKAAQHDASAFLEDWRTVLEGVAAAKQRRTTLESVTLTVTHLAPALFSVARVIGGRSRSSSSPTWRGRGKVKFDGRLEVIGHSPRATLDSAVVTLEAIDDGSPTIRAVPMTVRRTGTTFYLSATIDLASMFRGTDEAARTVRLRLAWENSSWQTTLPPPGS